MGSQKPTQGEEEGSFVKVLHDSNPMVDYKFRGLFHYPAPTEDLNITKGQLLKIVEPLDKSGYYKAETKDGRDGLVPSNYVEQTDESF